MTVITGSASFILEDLVRPWPVEKTQSVNTTWGAALDRLEPVIGTDANKTSMLEMEDEGHINLVKQHAQDIFSYATDIHFEDGVHYEFYDELCGFIRKYGAAALEEIDNLIFQSITSTEVTSVVLRQLGCIDDPATLRKRLSVLIKALDHSSPLIRDSAALGLAWLNHPIAIPYLQYAIDKEKIRDLQDDMKLVLAQLKELA